MRITEHHLRSIIRRILCEQVVGYKAPSKTYDDPLGDEDHSFSSPISSGGESEAVTGKSSSGDDDSPGYMQIGDISVATGVSDTSTQKAAGANLSPQDKQQMRSQMANLQSQRQDALNKGNSKQADYVGVQMRRLKDVLNP
jgi:hypothetical protein